MKQGYAAMGQRTWVLLSKKTFESHAILSLWCCNNFGTCEELLCCIYGNLAVNNYQQLPQTPDTGDL